MKFLFFPPADAERPAPPPAHRLAGVLLTLLAMALSAWAFTQVPRGLTEHPLPTPPNFPYNAWFQADAERVLQDLTLVEAERWRSHFHPNFTILFGAPVQLATWLGVPPFAAAAASVVLAAGGSTWLCYLLGSYLGLRTVGATLLTLCWLSSATFLHWYSVVETFSWGGVSTFAVLGCLARPASPRKAWWVLAHLLAFSVTITNWGSALVATAVRVPWRRALVIGLLFGAVALALNGVQKWIYPKSVTFFQPMLMRGEAKTYRAAPPGSVVRVFFAHSMVAPVPVVEKREYQVITNQFVSLGAHRWLGWVALAAWWGLLLLGIWTLLRGQVVPGWFALGLGGMLLGQLLLHLVYGELTFLYTAHFMPMLLVLAGVGFAGKWRRVALGLAAMFVCMGGVNSYLVFRQATQLAAVIVEPTVPPPR